MKSTLLTILLLLTGNVFAQWTSDPNSNTLICNVNNAQLLPKIAHTSTGETYITWFDGRSGNLDVYLQKLDINGNAQFATNGLLISSNPQNSWIGDYDIEVDAGDNLIITFSDRRGAGGGDTTINPYAYKISPSGTFLWGPNGIALSNVTATYQLWPKVSIASDGNLFFTWWEQLDTTSSIMTQRVSPNGNLLWAQPVKISPAPSDKNIYPNNAPSDNGSVLVSWCFGPQGGGSFVPDIKTIFVRKLDSTGAAVWTDSIFSKNTPDIPPYVVPHVVPDGNGGAYFSWMYSRNLNVLTSGVQRISSSGTLSFPPNGVDVSTDSNLNQVEPNIGVDQSGNIYAFWLGSNMNQNAYGLFGQKISPAGTRLWTDTGKTFIPLTSAEAPINILVNTNGNDVYVTYVLDTIGNKDRIEGYRLDNDGNVIWGPKGISTLLSEKSDMVGYNRDGAAVYTWMDNRGTMAQGSGIWAQSINSSGILGTVGVSITSSQVPDKYSLGQNYPNPFNPTTNIRFEIPVKGFVKLAVYDMLGREVKTLVNKELNAGSYNAELSGGDLTSGIYFYTLNAGDFSETKRMVLIK